MTIRKQRVHDIVDGFFVVIRAHYKDNQPSGRDKVAEVLNALANATAAIMAGTNKSSEAQEFFNNCLEQSIDQIIADKRKADHRVN